MLKNFLTIDVEDYYDVTDFDGIADKKIYPARLERNVDILLALLERFRVKATFFVLGKRAGGSPQLIKRIAGLGHEIACHSWGHSLIYNLGRKKFAEDTKKAKAILEDITGSAVAGYRAPSFSIVEGTLWALDTLAGLGFFYDSSIFPVYRKRYGVPNFGRRPVTVDCAGGKRITEIPLSSVRLCGINLPFSGGGYLRLLPYRVIKGCIKKINNCEKMPAVVYIHPWEIDPEHPRIKVNPYAYFRHYYNLKSALPKISMLLCDFSFIRMGDWCKMRTGGAV